MGIKVPIHFLKDRTQKGYTNFGMMWEKWQVTEEHGFRLVADEKEISLQSRVTAYWPDDSVKWTAHCGCLPKGTNSLYIEAVEPQETIQADEKNISLIKSNVNEDRVKGIKNSPQMTCIEQEGKIHVSSQRVAAVFDQSGPYIIRDLFIDGKCVVSQGTLVAILEERSRTLEGDAIKVERNYKCEIKQVVVEELGSEKVVIKLTGVHRNEMLQREVLPFILRWTLYNGEQALHLTHTFIYDGDPNQDFLKGLGIQINHAMAGEVYNRHIKIGGEYGNFCEALQMLLSWRPRLREGLYEEQLSGKILTIHEKQEPEAFEAIKRMTIWDNYRLTQSKAHSYSISKKTRSENCTFIHCMEGTHAKGYGYVQDEQTGLMIGMKEFWQKYPSSLWLEDLAGEEARLTAWIWSPEVEAMDFRHYDTVGHEGPYYEGFDEVGATPYGIANTNELILVGFTEGLAQDAILDEWQQVLNKPPVLVAEPTYYHKLKAFGAWSLPEKDTPLSRWLEQQMDKAIAFYKDEINERNWYGLFNYGDVMHTYDKARHCWRYDMGGYAWQNTELVPTHWLWYAFLRTGREDIFTMAEAMTRHCSEVDVYHLGAYKGIGSRHNVIHWGCACKEPRIAMAGHHRIFYYLTGDHRMEDIFEEVKDGDYSTLNIDPLRYFYNKEEMVYPTHARTGPDWSTYCSNWMTQWERKKDTSYRDKIRTGIEDIKKAPLRLISGSDYEYDPETGHLRYIGENAAGGTHLTICMGAAQTWLELTDLLEDETWNQMLADFGVCYFATKEERRLQTKGLVENREFGLPYMIAAVGAYAAQYYDDKLLAQKVWQVLIGALLEEKGENGFEIEWTAGISKETMQEIPFISTNFASQWCLNAIFCLEMIKEALPKQLV